MAGRNRLATWTFKKLVILNKSVEIVSVRLCSTAIFLCVSDLGFYERQNIRFWTKLFFERLIDQEYHLISFFWLATHSVQVTSSTHLAQQHRWMNMSIICRHTFSVVILCAKLALLHCGLAHYYILGINWIKRINVMICETKTRTHTHIYIY